MTAYKKSGERELREKPLNPDHCIVDGDETSRRWTYTVVGCTNAIGRFEMEFGPEIKVDGKRPEWLGEDDLVDWRREQGWRKDCAKDYQERVAIRTPEWSSDEWSAIQYIRLPANHPHYITPTPDERVMALLKRIAAPNKVDIYQWQTEARAIVAALEPVDPDEAEAELIYEGWSSNPDEDVRSLVARTLARGRQLEKEGK